MKERLYQILDRLEAAWDGLNERERVMVSALGGTLAVFVLFVGWFLSSNAMAERRDRLEEMDVALGAIEAAADDYGAREGERRAHEARLDREVPSLKGHLEELANTAGIPIDSFGSEKRTTAKGKKYDEVTVEVKFRRVELPRITDYMHKLESDPSYVFVIKRLNVRVDFSDKKLLNVEMEVASYIRVAPPDKPPEPAGDEGASAGDAPGPGPGPATRPPPALGKGKIGIDATFGDDGDGDEGAGAGAKPTVGPTLPPRPMPVRTGFPGAPALKGSPAVKLPAPPAGKDED